MQPCPRHQATPHAFSLAELLAVIAVVAVLAALVAPAFKGLGQANRLNLAGIQAGNLINLARQHAMSTNTMTALVVLTDSNTESQYRTFALLELTPAEDGAFPVPGDWRQLSKWETLPSGIVLDPSSDSRSGHEYFFNLNKAADAPSEPGVPTPSFPPLQYQTNPDASFSYIVFLPDGSLLKGATAQLRFAEGQTSTPPANYYDISVLAETGRSIINRP